MKYISEENNVIVAKCEVCSNYIHIPKTRCKFVNLEFKVNPPLSCECKTISNVIKTDIFNNLTILQYIKNKLKYNKETYLAIFGIVFIIISIIGLFKFCSYVNNNTSYDKYLEDTLNRAKIKSINGQQLSPDEKRALDSEYKWYQEEYDKAQRKRFEK